MAVVRVDVTDEYLSRLIKDPLAGLKEIIWNALDADATNVTISFTRSPLDAIETLTVTDDGDGITTETAMRAFGTLGGSWKRDIRHSSNGRPLHGRRGHGRWAAFAIGETVTWSSITAETSAKGSAAPLPPQGRYIRTRIVGHRESLGEFNIRQDIASESRTGTTVTIDQVLRSAQGLDSNSTYDKLNVTFALYLQRHPSITIRVGDRPLDPSILHARIERLSLPDTTPLYARDAELIVVEWMSRVREAATPRLVLVDEDGDGLMDIKDGLPYSPIPYSAYFRWDGFRKHKDQLPLALLGAEPVAPVVGSGLFAIREYMHGRATDARTALLRQWKEEKSYPYVGEPKDEVDAAERDLFDLLAVTAAPALQGNDARARRLSLRLIQEALQRDPTQVGRIFEEVLGLTDEQLTDLTALLNRTSLSSMISTAKTIAHRLDVLAGLDEILFSRQLSPHVLERRHLHEIVAAEPWVFGEEYGVSVSDRSLTTVLKAHRELLGEEQALIDDEPVLLDGRIARVDLLMSRSVENATNRYEHLVVELKRPSVEIGPEQVTQLEQYAIRVAGDSRFIGQDVSWDFLLVGTKLSDYARWRAAREPTVQGNDKIKIRFASWGDIIGQSRHRMKFIQRELALVTRDDDGLDELRRMHASALPGVITTRRGSGQDQHLADGVEVAQR